MDFKANFNDAARSKSSSVQGSWDVIKDELQATQELKANEARQKLSSEFSVQHKRNLELLQSQHETELHQQLQKIDILSLKTIEETIHLARQHNHAILKALKKDHEEKGPELNNNPKILELKQVIMRDQAIFEEEYQIKRNELAQLCSNRLNGLISRVNQEYHHEVVSLLNDKKLVLEQQSLVEGAELLKKSHVTYNQVNQKAKIDFQHKLDALNAQSEKDLTVQKKNLEASLEADNQRMLKKAAAEYLLQSKKPANESDSSHSHGCATSSHAYLPQYNSQTIDADTLKIIEEINAILEGTSNVSQKIN